MKEFKAIIKNKSIEVLQIDKGEDGFRLLFFFNDKMASLIVSKGAGWEHASISYLDGTLPSWDEMCKLKDLIWNDDEEVIQIHPKKNQYVNNMNNCLHLWRCYYKEMVLPPSVLVGLRPNQTEREFMRELKKAYIEAGEESPV